MGDNGQIEMDRKKRIKKEREEFMEWKSSVSCDGCPQENEDTWIVTMDGPRDSPYMGGKFKIKIYFGPDYPKTKPDVNFETPICHINIGSYICITALTKYQPSYSILFILSQIFMMLTSPNELSPLNSEYFKLYKDDYSGYLAKARQMTREHAH